MASGKDNNMSLLELLKSSTDLAYTENGALTHTTTQSSLYDLFALGGAYRSRSDEQVMNLFAGAYDENPEYALKCLFYLRDRSKNGQGERRFFRVAYKWLIEKHENVAMKFLDQISEYGRWDDLIYICYNTKLWKKAIEIIRNQLTEDLMSMRRSDKTPVSLLGKWMPSENTSSLRTRRLANDVRKALGETPRSYRVILSKLRERINIVETLMSHNRWEEIEFDKLPSKAGIKYRKAYSSRAETRDRYHEFMSSKTTNVNAGTLTPVDVVKAAFGEFRNNITTPSRMAVNKYWENLNDYFNDCEFNGVAVVDTSGSMTCTYGVGSRVRPIDVAIALGIYCADKAKGPFYKHFITFSDRPSVRKITGADFVAEVKSIYDNTIISNTDIEAVFRLILDTAVASNLVQKDLPENIIVISDMEFDSATRLYGRTSYSNTLMENIRIEYEKAGYKLPHLVYWNVNARNDNIADAGPNTSFVSGFSPTILELVLKGKKGYDLMMDKLNSERYAPITLGNNMD